jgi:hypothetical protein
MEAERFDVEVSSRFGKRAALVLEAGLRMVPEGTLVDGAIEGALPLRAGSVSLGVRSAGWVEPASLSPETLEYRARIHLSIR